VGGQQKKKLGGNGWGKTPKKRNARQRFPVNTQDKNEDKIKKGGKKKKISKHKGGKEKDWKPLGL